MNEHLNRDLARLTKEILASYDAERSTHRIGEQFLPSKDKIVKILVEIRRLLFPGYYGHQKLSRENIGPHVSDLLVRLGADLAEQVKYCRCMWDHCGEDCPHPEKCGKEAAEITAEFLSRIPKIRAMLALDARAAYDGDPAAKSIGEVIFCYPGFFAVTVYRVAHELVDLGVVLMPRIMTEYAHGVTGVDIHPGARIGKSFFIDHATGVVVGETTEIGDNVKIYQGVTLGARSFPKDERGRAIKGVKRHPTLEDNVTIYANATILGGKTRIGKGVTVSGNTFVTESIAADSLIRHRGQKLMVISKKELPDDWVI